MSPKNNFTISRVTVIVIAAAVLPSIAHYAENAEQEQVFNLSPFEVQATEDRGYLIAETTSATRFAVDRRDLPFSITALSSDLLEEIHAVNALEALDLSSSATPSESVFTGDNNRPTIRGTSSPRFFVEGLFFNSTAAPGGIAVDSIEILKGTSAMLYGQGEPGGTVNYQLKKPQDKFSGRIMGMVGSFNEKEMRFEVTGPLNSAGTLTYFGGYSYFYGESTHDRYSSESKDGFARLRWNYDGHNRFVDVYHIYNHRHQEGIVQHILDGHYGITNLQMKTEFYSRFEVNGLPNPLELGMLVPGKHNDSAEGSFADVRTNSTTVSWNHGFLDNFTLRASYNRTRMPRYLWRNLADPTVYVETSPSRSFLFTDPETGMPDLITLQRGDIAKNRGGQLRDDELLSDSYVVNLLGDFNVGGARWQSVVGIDHVSEVFETESWFSNWHYNQLSNGGSSLMSFGDRIPIVLGNVFRPEEGLSFGTEPLETYTVHSGFSSSENVGTGYYWTNFLQMRGGRLSLVGSLRHDRTELVVNGYRPMRTDGLDVHVPGTPASFSKTTYSIGGNWYILRNWGVFANYATSFRPEVSSRDGRDRLPVPADQRVPFEGEGWDAGIKFTTEDGRFFAMATIFQTKKRNIWTRVSGQRLDPDGNLMWDDDEETVPTLTTWEVQTGEQLAEGIEVDITGELTRNFQLRLGWTWMPTVEISKDEEEFLVGQRIQNSPEHKITAGIRYDIREGPLSFASMGFNINALIDNRIYWVGPNNRRLHVGNLGDGSPYVGEADRFWGTGYTRVDFFFRKRFRLENNNDIWLRLVVYNIFDEKHQRYRQIGTTRSFRLSADYRW